jgi:anti-anti-sigma factor
METSVFASDGKAVIRLSGHFDLSAHRAFREAVERAMVSCDVQEVLVDLAGVGYLDSSALGMLLMLRDRARANAWHVCLANCRDDVKQALCIANFGRLFAIT